MAFCPTSPTAFLASGRRAIDSIGGADFNTILPGHAALQTGRTRMVNLRNYIEELTGRVEESRKSRPDPGRDATAHHRGLTQVAPLQRL